MGIIPDKFILLEQDDSYSMEKIKGNLQQEDSLVRSGKCTAGD